MIRVVFEVAEYIVATRYIEHDGLYQHYLLFILIAFDLKMKQTNKQTNKQTFLLLFCFPRGFPI